MNVPTRRRWQTRAVLFDLDGVLVDSMPVIGRLLDRWADLHGLNREMVQRTAHGRREEELAAELVPWADPAGQVALMQSWQLTEFEGCRPCPGALQLLEQLDGRLWAVVTSASRAVARGRLRAAGLEPPRLLITSDDVSRGKPHPEPYLRAATGLGLRPADCVVVEDAPSGVAAGIAAGMRVLAVTDAQEWSWEPADDVAAVRSLEAVEVAEE
jgi:sugar-phosphatase